MAYFKITEPNKPTKWIKEVDGANGTITFQNEREGAYYEDEGFFADSEFDYIKHHFTEKYPELEYMHIDSSWGDYEGVEGVGEPIAEQIAEVGVDAPRAADFAVAHAEAWQ
jgi:hypothetical protein